MVPEHIETRSLYDLEIENFEHGKIQMWIDMFPNDTFKIPKPVNIELAKPIKLELRVIIKNTKDVYLDNVDLLTNQKSSDIYVLGWIGDQSNMQKTDTHFRSVTGEGNFNFRFIFNLDFLPGENKIIIKDHKFLSFETIEKKIDPILHLEVWDANYVAKVRKIIKKKNFFLTQLMMR